MSMPDVTARSLSHPGPSPLPDIMLDPESARTVGTWLLPSVG